jgi:hypothetical protein
VGFTSDGVVIGMDPHKRSATIEVMSADEVILGGGRFGTDRDGYAAMARYGRQWPNQVWAIEGCAGIGKHIANRLLADGEQVVDVPPEAVSAGAGLRHRAGPQDRRHRRPLRRANRVLHIMARVQIRNSSKGRDYYERKKADGKAPMEAMRCVKRRLSDIVYWQMLHDALAQTQTGPGGHQGTSTDSSVTGSHPHTGSSDKSFPSPPPNDHTPTHTARSSPSSPRPHSSADPQPASSALCLTPARTGAS